MEYMPDIVVILNPAAGRGYGGKSKERLAHLLNKTGKLHPLMTWELVETHSKGDGIAIARSAVESGAKVVAAAGGDGTCGEVVNGIVGAEACLGIVPLGTGNDMARTLGIGNDIEGAVHTLFEGKSRAVDLGKLDHTWFINVAGCGFDALVADRVNRGIHYARGTTAYIIGLLQILAAFRAAHFKLDIDGKQFKARGMLCAIANAPSYGGGMKIAPDAKIDDGYFDIIFLGEVSKYEFIKTFPRVYKGTHLTHPGVKVFRAKELTLGSEPPLPLLVDGEVLGFTPAKFTLYPLALKVMTP
jgi:diacylglycerol kinase (ATP)